MKQKFLGGWSKFPFTFSDEDDDDLFKSAVGGQASKLREDERTDEESGYDSVLAKNNQDQEVPR